MTCWGSRGKRARRRSRRSTASSARCRTAHLPAAPPPCRACAPRLTFVCVPMPAKQHHPDLNQGDAAAAAKFDRVTTAYNSAMESTNSESWKRSPRGGGRATATAARPSAPPWRPTDRSKFNVHEWERMHYGMHGGRGEHKGTEFMRQAWRHRGPTAARYTGDWKFGNSARNSMQSSQSASRGSGPNFFMMFCAISGVWGMALYSMGISSGRGRR